jgi:hypothetical protein
MSRSWWPSVAVSTSAADGLQAGQQVPAAAGKGDGSVTERFFSWLDKALS